MTEPSSPTDLILDAIDDGRFATCPAEIGHAAKSALINWFGCAVGASTSDPVKRALQTSTAVDSGAPIYGAATSLPLREAAFVNCLASAIYAFDDTHVPTITHPTGPVAAALFALAHHRPIAGPDFLAGLIAGIEVQCKLSNALLIHEPQPKIGLYITGVTGPIGAAAGIAQALRLPRQMSGWALGLAATQGAGLRSTHGAMSGAVVPAFAAQAGLQAGLLAMSGFSTPPDVLGAPRGYFELFAPGWNGSGGLDGLGDTYEILDVSLKPYPCGVVIHPILAELEAARPELPEAGQITFVDIAVGSATLTLADRPQPDDMFDAIVSVQHWVATLLHGRPTGIAALQADQLSDPALVDLRSRIRLTTSPELSYTQFRCRFLLADGEVREIASVEDDPSADISLDTSAVEQKFLDQAAPILGNERAADLLALLWRIETVPTDVGASIEAALGLDRTQASGTSNSNGK